MKRVFVKKIKIKEIDIAEEIRVAYVFHLRVRTAADFTDASV